MRTDQSTHTSDAKRETRGGPAQGVTQAINGNDIFALMDSISLSSDFDGQVPREQTIDLPNHALGREIGAQLSM